LLTRGKYRTIYKAIFVASFFSSVIFLAIFIFYFLNPIAFRSYIFQPIREFLFFQRELSLPQEWSSIKKITVPPAERIEIPSNEESNLKIVADLRLPQQEGLSPALLLLHGSSPWGRKNGLIVLLSHRFQSLGWVTLLPDARGFGETDDPLNLENTDSWSVKYDVKRFLDYLSAHPRTDPDRIYILGHSMGAAHALEGALNNTNAMALVLIEPPRFPNGIKAGLWRRARFSSDRRLKCLLPEEVVNSISFKSGIGYFAKTRLQNNSHLPILLIVGEREGENNLKFLNEITRNMSQPINCHTIKKTGHYLSVYNFFGSEIIFYRPDIFNFSISLMLNFINEIESTK
jgi:pimeloyl-ACP methyl ester carboxylesterase